MTTRTLVSPRRGFTLIELLVVMALIAALGALTLGLLPGIVNKDNTLKATAEVQGALRIAQAQAASSKQPRGVRFLPNPNNPAVATEMQYLEAPQVTVSDLQVLVSGRPQPYVEFRYEYDPQGRITNRHCHLVGLNGDQLAAVQIDGTLTVPTLGAWSRIRGNYLPANPQTNPPSGEIVLDVYPDAPLGAAGPPANSGVTGRQPVYRSYHFGIYGPPVPMLGEPTVPLPKDIAVDLTLCLPQGAAGVSYDVMFAPTGQTTSSRFGSTQLAANAGVFLWVRDFRQVPALNPVSRAPWQFNYNDFLRGGEQQVVGIRNGYVGTAPVLWPNATGSYAGQDPYSLARAQLD